MDTPLKCFRVSISEGKISWFVICSVNVVIIVSPFYLYCYAKMETMLVRLLLHNERAYKAFNSSFKIQNSFYLCLPLINRKKVCVNHRETVRYGRFACRSSLRWVLCPAQ